MGHVGWQRSVAGAAMARGAAATAAVVGAREGDESDSVATRETVGSKSKDRLVQGFPAHRCTPFRRAARPQRVSLSLLFLTLL